MTPNPVDEIKRIRHQLGAEMDFSVHLIFEDLRTRQATSGRTYVGRSPRRIADGNLLQRSGEASVVEVETLSPPAER